MKISNLHQGKTIHIESEDHVYKPGLLTETICNLMVVKKGDVAVDVGCGTGYIGIMAALLGAEKVIAIDPIKEALDNTLHNADLNNLSNVLVMQGTELEPVKGQKVDLILSLPPQMPFSSNFNPSRYGGLDGTDVIFKIIKEASLILNKNNGRFYLIHAALANPKRVRQALIENGFQWEIIETLEKELDKDDLNTLSAGLFDYLVDLYRKGMAELIERNGSLYYRVWFYLIRQLN